MADNQRYYYMRLKDNFFETDSIAILESMQDGYLYSNILLKLYLKSLKDNGRLMFNGRIPYNAQMLATITRHQVGTVEMALKIFKEMGLIEIIDNGAMYMLDIQNFIGNSSTEADRKRQSDRRIQAEKNGIGEISEKSPRNVGEISEKCVPEIEIEIEKEIEIDIDTEKEKETKLLKKKNKTKKENTEIVDIFKNFTSNPLLLKNLIDFMDMRKEKKSTLTIRAAKGILNKLEKMVENKPINDREFYMIQILEESIINGWKGVYELKDNYNSSSRKNIFDRIDEA